MKSIICPECGMNVCTEDIYQKKIWSPIRCQYCGAIVVEPDECFTNCDTLDYEELDTKTLELLVELEDL